MNTKSHIGHRLRETLVHGHRLVQPANRPRILIFPSEPMSPGSASDLRGWAIVRELRRLGWRANAVPAQLEHRQRDRIVRFERPDIILLQQSRHPLNRPRFFGGLPCVFDADDADVMDPRCTDAVVECCRESAAVIAGNRYLANIFRQHNPRVNVIWTGTYVRSRPVNRSDRQRSPIITWASSAPALCPVEAQLIQALILRLAEENRFEFYLYGVNNPHWADGYTAPLRRAGIPVRIFPPMPYKKFIRSLETVAIGLQPICMSHPFSRGKSFGKLLAYMASGVAIVASDNLDHPLFFQHKFNGMLASENLDDWTSCCRLLLVNADVREQIAQRGQTDLSRRLTTARAAELVDRVLVDVLNTS